MMPELKITVSGPPKSGKSRLIERLLIILRGFDYSVEVNDNDEPRRLIFGTGDKQKVIITTKLT